MTTTHARPAVPVSPVLLCAVCDEPAAGEHSHEVAVAVRDARAHVVALCHWCRSSHVLAVHTREATRVAWERATHNRPRS